MGVPIIGVTTMRREYQSGMPLASVAEAYVEALIQAGASPVLIPNALSEEALDELTPRLDGVLFSGGGDVDPQFYSTENYSKVSGVELDRDRLEIYLLEMLVSEGTPFLGICRGQQSINVALGGTLYADIADQMPGSAKHDYYPGWERDYLAHSVKVERGSRLADILGESEVEVNSFHHQAVEQLAPGLTPTAYSPDGIIEAVELADHPFALAVQWHPEWLTAHQPMRALFQAFVEAASAE
jgi:putative glutamine amidotransferase